MKSCLGTIFLWHPICRSLWFPWSYGLKLKKGKGKTKGTVPKRNHCRSLRSIPSVSVRIRNIRNGRRNRNKEILVRLNVFVMGLSGSLALPIWKGLSQYSLSLFIWGMCPVVPSLVPAPLTLRSTANGFTVGTHGLDLRSLITYPWVDLDIGKIHTIQGGCSLADWGSMLASDMQG